MTLEKEAHRELEPEVTEIVQTQRRIPALTLAGVTMAAALLVGIVGTGVQSIVQDAARAKAAEQAKWAAYGAAWEQRYRAERGLDYISPHDKAVLKAAQEWEVRYRAMYPAS